MFFSGHAVKHRSCTGGGLARLPRQPRRSTRKPWEGSERVRLVFCLIQADFCNQILILHVLRSTRLTHFGTISLFFSKFCHFPESEFCKILLKIGSNRRKFQKFLVSQPSTSAESVLRNSKPVTNCSNTSSRNTRRLTRLGRSYRLERTQLNRLLTS